MSENSGKEHWPPEVAEIRDRGECIRFRHGPNTKWVRDDGGRLLCIPENSVEGTKPTYEVSAFTLEEWLEGPWHVDYVSVDNSPFVPSEGGDST